MKCAICDKTLTAEEIKFDRDHKSWNPCFTCLNIVADVFSDPLDEDQIQYLLDLEGDYLLQDPDTGEDFHHTL